MNLVAVCFYIGLRNVSTEIVWKNSTEKGGAVLLSY